MISTPFVDMASAEIMHREVYSVRKRPALKTQIERMRRDVQANGECIVQCDELRVLCADAPASNQWDAIAKIAIDERWSFTFFPDGSVRFAML